MSRSFDVLYRFLAKDSFTNISKKIRGENKHLNASFKGLDKQVNKFRKSSSKMGDGVMQDVKRMALAYLSFQSIKAAIAIGAEFQASMADLSAITGATGKDLDTLQGKILSMAKASVSSQADVATAIKLVASAKPELLSNLDALAATTEQVLLLKNAAGIELADAANITAQSLNIFGKGAKDAAEFVNILAAGAKLGASEIADTGEAVLIAGPGARAAGLSFAQLNAAIQTVAQGGIKGTQAGTALNAIFGRMRRLGIDFQKIGLEKSFDLVRKALDGTKNSTARAQLEAKIFGEEHAKVGLAILANSTLLGQYETSLVGTTVAQDQADIRLGTLASKWAGLGILLKDVLIRVFLQMEPILSKLVLGLTGFMDSIDPAKVSAFAESFGLLLSGIITVGSAISTVLMPVVNVLLGAFQMFMAILKGIGTLIGEVIGAFATMDFSGISNLMDSFSVGGKFLGVFGGAETAAPSVAVPPVSVGAPTGAGSSSTTDINMNIKAPQGVVQSVQSRTTGSRNANVGINMAGG